MQVGLTDETPIYLLGGTITTLGGGGMTTDAARNSSLTFVAALPSSATTPAPLLSGVGCPAASNGSIAACGHMYLDTGEELDIGSAADNYISLTAELTVRRG